jgi:hypothetical protein
MPVSQPWDIAIFQLFVTYIGPNCENVNRNWEGLKRSAGREIAVTVRNPSHVL